MIAHRKNIKLNIKSKENFQKINEQFLSQLVKTKKGEPQH